MNYLAKKYKSFKKNLFASSFVTGVLLFVVVAFLFNLNFDSPSGRAQSVGIIGEGHLGYVPKWKLNTMLACYEVKANAIVNVTASQPSIYTGGSTTISWSSENAVSCTGTNMNTGGVLTNMDGVEVTPNSTTTYTVSCTSASGQVTTSSVTVTVKKRPKFIEN